MEDEERVMGDLDDGPDPSRRDALKKIALGTGTMATFPILGQGTLVPETIRSAHANAAGYPSLRPEPEWKPTFLDEHQNGTVVALSDLIIPETDTPGAKAALVNRYMDLVLSQEDPDKQKSFIQGLAWMNARSLKLYGKPFVRASAQQQIELLTPLADPDNKNPEDQSGVQFFQEFKDLTIFAYYTSRIGMEQELQYGGDDYHTEFPGACTHPEHQT